MDFVKRSFSKLRGDKGSKDISAYVPDSHAIQDWERRQAYSRSGEAANQWQKHDRGRTLKKRHPSETRASSRGGDSRYYNNESGRSSHVRSRSETVERGRPRRATMSQERERWVPDRYPHPQRAYTYDTSRVDDYQQNAAYEHAQRKIAYMQQLAQRRGRSENPQWGNSQREISWEPRTAFVKNLLWEWHGKKRWSDVRSQEPRENAALQKDRAYLEYLDKQRDPEQAHIANAHWRYEEHLTQMSASSRFDNRERAYPDGGRTQMWSEGFDRNPNYREVANSASRDQDGNIQWTKFTHRALKRIGDRYENGEEVIIKDTTGRPLWSREERRKWSDNGVNGVWNDIWFSRNQILFENRRLRRDGRIMELYYNGYPVTDEYSVNRWNGREMLTNLPDGY